MRILIFIMCLISLPSCREATRVDPLIEDETEKDMDVKDNEEKESAVARVDCLASPGPHFPEWIARH